jgi:hypothetical protein
MVSLSWLRVTRRSFVVLLIIFCVSLLNSVLTLLYLVPKVFSPPIPPSNGSSCPLCSFAPLHTPTSSRRDVILAAALTELKRVEYFLRTLRTTGTRARIILFLDNAETASVDWLRFFQACDIEPVFVEHVNPVIRSAPKLSRYYFYQQWLLKHIDEVDRVIHTDTFDVIFQSDPFLPHLNASKLYFTFEPVTLGDSHWTMQWIQQCYGKDSVKPFRRLPVSCSGVTAGGARPFLTYLTVLLAHPVWTSCFGHSLDQAHHNWLWYNGQFGAAGLEIESLDCNSEFLTMHFCCNRASCALRDNGVIYGNNTGRAPVLVHQYNRWKNLTRRNPVMCPVGDGGLLAATKGGAAAAVERLPPLITAFPERTLWPP